MLTNPECVLRHAIPFQSLHRELPNRATLLQFLLVPVESLVRFST